MVTRAVRLLGGFSVALPGGRRARFEGRKAQALLAYIACQPERRLSRAALCAMFWPDSEEPLARASLRQTLKRARRALADGPGEAVRSDASAVWVDAAWLDVDVVRFGALAASRDTANLMEAADLYAGELLEGFPLPEGAFADWAIVERARLHELAVQVHANLVDAHCRAGNAAAAIAAARRLVTLEPLNEVGQRTLISLYAKAGRHGMARAHAEAFEDLLRRDLGVEPAPATRELLARVPPTAPAKPAGGGIRTGLSATGRAGAAGATSQPAVAVLPIPSAGHDPDHRHLADGICSEITTTLGHWRSFPVIPRETMRTLPSPDRLGEAMGDGPVVGYLATVGLRLGGRRPVVTIRLIDHRSGQQLLADRLDLDPADLEGAVDDLARKVSARLGPELHRAEAGRICRRGCWGLAGWESLLCGLAELERCTTDGNAAARERFRQAAAADPTSSAAAAGLAFGHLRDLFAARVPRRAAALRHGEAAARRSVSLDCNSSFAHHALATAHVWNDAQDLMILETACAVDLNPSNAAARMALGNRLDLVGDAQDGIAQMEAALALNPRDPRRFVFMGFLSRACLASSDPEAALGWARRAVTLRPDLPDPRFRLALALAELDCQSEARAALAEAERLAPGYLERQAGWQPYSDPERSARILDGLRRHSLLGPATP